MTDKEKTALLECIILFICSISVCGFTRFVWNAGYISIPIKWVSLLGTVGMYILFAAKVIEWMKIRCIK